MNDNGFFVGDGIDGREKFRQKFSNLQASYIKYVDKRKQTEEGKIVKPPFYDELKDIMGDKHKIEPILVLDSLPIGRAEMEKVQEEKNKSEDGQQPSTSNRFSEVKHSVKPNKNEILFKMYELNTENQKMNEKNFHNMMEFLNKESEQRKIMSLIENMGNKSKKSKRNDNEDSD
ncbi:hypothetical protein JTB14_025923 [Gonioctena quinquepunctata]|nr:hypothetical protein JTB14_025923 [Gonioctena quinquepunctata]